MSDDSNDVLIEVAWLAQHLDDPSLHLIDARLADPRVPFGYRTGHIPHAIALDPLRDFFVYDSRTRELKSPEQIAEALGRHSITNDALIVLYDDWTGELAAIAFWVLRYIGHREVKILNGGLAAWHQAGGEITRAMPSAAITAYHAAPNDDTHATAEWIQQNAARSDMVLLDARSEQEFVAGHIPGAVNWSFEQALDLRAHRYRDIQRLQAQLKVIGATPDKEIVVYCHVGNRSSHLFTTLSILGYPRARNYSGSMADWFETRRLPIDSG